MIKLYHMDAIDLLKTLEDNSVQAIIQDIPYGGTEYTVNYDRGVTENKHLDDDFWKRFFKEARRVVKKNGYIASTTYFKKLDIFLKNAVSNGFEIQKFLFWYVNSLTYMMKGMIPHDVILIVILGDRIKKERVVRLEKYFEGGVLSSLWVIPGHTKDNIRLQGKQPLEPVAMLVELLTDEGDLVVDPFCGSGTTGEACAILNRRFIGGDINKNILELAKIRLGGYI